MAFEIALEFTRSVILPISSGALTLMRSGRYDATWRNPSEFIDRQLVQRSQTTVGQVVDVIDVRGLVLSTQLQHVLDDLEEVLGTDVHDGLVDILVELAVHTEATNLAQSVLVLFVEAFREEFSSLVDLEEGCPTEPTINLQEGRFVLGDLGQEVKLLFSNGVQINGSTDGSTTRSESKPEDKMASRASPRAAPALARSSPVS